MQNFDLSIQRSTRRNSMSKSPLLRKDIRVEIVVKNNLILTKMKEMGIETVAELSRKTRIQQRTLGLIVNMKKLPVTKKGKWTKSAEQLADFFCCLPEDLFSKLQQKHALSKNRAYAEMHFSHIQAMIAVKNAHALDPSIVLQTHEQYAILESMIEKLDPNLQKVIRGRFGFDGPEKTLAKIGEEFNVSRETIRKWERDALRQLRRPSKSKLLRPLLAGFIEQA